VRLAFDTHGPSDGRTIVLLHGLSDNRRTWDGCVEDLARSHRLLVADLRGHGESPHGGSYRAGDYATDVAELIEAEVGGPAIVVGHSLGGLTASALAAARPDLVAAIFLGDPPLFEGDAEARAASPAAAFFPAFVAAVRAWQAAGADEAEVVAATGGQPSPHGGTVVERVGPEAVAARARGLLRFDPRAMDAAIDGSTWDGYDPTAAMACPVTVLRADPAVGAVFLPENEAPYRAAVPHAEVILAAGQDHGIHGDPVGRGLFLDALEQFLADLG
jgi:pimeloyl-ACP methyl ester carboxylesterase